MIELIAYISLIFPCAIGIMTIYFWCKKPKPPADDSNRINNITAWWIGLTRPEVLAMSLKYFGNDVLENIKKVQESENGK
jgi:hypothetical protein